MNKDKIIAKVKEALESGQVDTTMSLLSKALKRFPSIDKSRDFYYNLTKSILLEKPAMVSIYKKHIKDMLGEKDSPEEEK